MTSTSGLTRSGKTYVGCVTLAGGAAIFYACFDLYQHPLDWQWFILAGLTLLSGSITVRVPSIPAAISVSETFVFTAVMLFGPSAGTITVALDGLVISLWLQRKKREAYKALFNVAAPSVSLWASAQIYFRLSGCPPLATAPQTPVSDVLFPLIAFTLAYFLLNSWLIAIAISLEKATTATRVWKENFVWLSLNFFSGASVAVLLVAYTRRLDSTAVGIIIPLLVISYLTYKTSMDRLEDTTRHLSELNVLYLSTIETLAMWIDAKDQITHGHIRRVQDLAVRLARELGVRDEKLIKAIEAAALLHDMGKLAIPEHILNKPGRLTPGEFEKMKTHASIGAQILSSIDFPYPVVPIVRHHHENWNGTGYPDGLNGTDIPIGARVLAVVDCFDALTSDRPYRPRLEDSEALQVLAGQRGSMYDPLVVDAFLRLEKPESSALPVADSAHSVLGNVRGDHAATLSGSNRQVIRHDEDITSIDLRGEPGKRLLNVARQVLPVSLAVLFWRDIQQDALYVAHAEGDGADELSSFHMKVGQGVSGWVAANRRAMANSDALLDLGSAFRSNGFALRSCLSLPVVLGDSLLGVITLYSNEPSRFSQQHVELVESYVADFIKDLGRRSHTLEDSPVSHGAGAFAAPEAALTHGHLYGQRIAVVLLQHEVHTRLSETVRRELVARIDALVRENVRGGDITIRTSEKELLVVLPQSDNNIARGTADRITRNIVELRFSQRNRTLVPITAKYGVAVSPDDGSSLDSLVASARRDASSPACLSEQDACTVH